MLSTTTNLQLQIIKNIETCAGEEIYLDKKLVAAQIVLWTLYVWESLWRNSEEKTRLVSEIKTFRAVQALNDDRSEQ